jgi:hypothetical protein
MLNSEENKMKNIFATIAVCMSFATPALSHSGGTDSNGCHAGSKPHHCHTTTTVSETVTILPKPKPRPASIVARPDKYFRMVCVVTTSGKQYPSVLFEIGKAGVAMKEAGQSQWFIGWKDGENGISNFGAKATYLNNKIKLSSSTGVGVIDIKNNTFQMSGSGVTVQGQCLKP